MGCAGTYCKTCAGGWKEKKELEAVPAKYGVEDLESAAIKSVFFLILFFQGRGMS